MNAHSGRHSTSPDDCARYFPGHRVEEIRGSDLVSRINNAIGDGVAFVGVAGGDGTIRTGAEHLVGAATPLLAVPAGTRNHFAHQLGIVDLDAACRAAAGRVEAVDVGEVNGRCFINNAAIGMYPEMVKRRETLQRRGLSKRAAQVVAVFAQLFRGHRFAVTMDGDTYRSWMIFVGNGHYGDDILDLTSRHTLNQAVLDIRLVRADRFLARTRVLAALMVGRLHRSRLLVQRTVGEIVFSFTTEGVDVSLDGELVSLEGPLRFRSRPGQLLVLLQPETGATPHPHVLRHPPVRT
ncbi:MAG: NAD(+)/NADH kinase [Actinomycetota bacterium]|nr:NAD(+)/NADH kinase [Actinomycetota bacterium]